MTDKQVLFIRYNDSGTIGHPILESNLRVFYPDLDTSNPPTNYARFERFEPPFLDKFQVLDKVTYDLSDEYTEKYGTPTYMDVFHIRDMTDEEKQDKIDSMKHGNLPEGFADTGLPVETQEETIPPKPTDDEYVWDLYTNNWVSRTKLREIFLPFFTKYGMTLETFNFENLTEDQQAELQLLIDKLKASQST